MRTLLGTGALIAVKLLCGAEMTNWQFIVHWIVKLHPDLLMWNELAKYLPALSAAHAKYIALESMADWGKLTHPHEELAEFSNPDLSIPYVVSREISGKYGNTGVRNIKPNLNNSHMQELLDQAMMIVDTCGVARTIDGMALRR